MRSRRKRQRQDGGKGRRAKEKQRNGESEEKNDRHEPGPGGEHRRRPVRCGWMEVDTVFINPHVFWECRMLGRCLGYLMSSFLTRGTI